MFYNDVLTAIKKVWLEDMALAFEGPVYRTKKTIETKPNLTNQDWTVCLSIDQFFLVQLPVA